MESATSIFEVKEHTVECQHIREYARATADYQEDVLRLAIKQYIPRDNPNPEQGDVTIIGAHANGYPKELYEPLWEDLHARSKANGFRIRSIWIADIAHEGASSVLNERLIGNDPSWTDHARDLLHMVNTFRSEIPQPIIGVGHSMGGNILTNLALMHPRLLTTIVMLDPVIQQYASATAGPDPNRLSTFRRDLWPTREAAETAFRNSPAYKKWDPRVLDRWCAHAIRPTPTAIHPEPNAYTLTTPKHQECFYFARPSWPAFSPSGTELLHPELLPDLHPASPVRFPFYRPEPMNTFLQLPQLRPSVLYIYGTESGVCEPEGCAKRRELTGTGHGGSGGIEKGRVEEVFLQGYGHLIAQEATTLCAEGMAPWVGKEVQRWKKGLQEYLEWTKKPLVEKQTLSEEWKRRVGGPPVKKAKEAKGSKL
ncbi:toxin biosynthesis protein [Rutstroemia sp. NJR-2017a BBW]|nr:toxin biosynthesis protein [Rutstroemia sp. NJR-2017a BBW]